MILAVHHEMAVTDAEIVLVAVEELNIRRSGPEAGIAVARSRYAATRQRTACIRARTEKGEQAL
jgi:hypothetical protein